MTDILTCHRCGLADASVVTREQKKPHHVSWAKCVAALKADRKLICRPPAKSEHGTPVSWSGGGEGEWCSDCGAPL